MTLEEAIEFGNMWLQVNEDFPNSNTYKFFQMAIKALEQEPILDKIRAEIEAKCCITVGRENDGAITLHDVFEIIDEYKGESEDNNGKIKTMPFL